MREVQTLKFQDLDVLLRHSVFLDFFARNIVPNEASLQVHGLAGYRETAVSHCDATVFNFSVDQRPLQGVSHFFIQTQVFPHFNRVLKAKLQFDQLELCVNIIEGVEVIHFFVNHELGVDFLGCLNIVREE